MGSSCITPVVLFVAGIASLLAISDASACCPNDGQGKPLAAKTGLGAASPAALDLSQDASWHVYQFVRDGIDYVQVNDRDGAVRAAAGKIGDMAWVMPIGSDADRVVIASAPTGTIVHRSAAFVVSVVRGANGDSWVVTPVSPPR